MHVNLIMKTQSFYLSLNFWSILEAIFPLGRRKFCWVESENVLGNGFEKYSLGRVSLGLLHGRVLEFIPKFTYFALV